MVGLCARMVFVLSPSIAWLDSLCKEGKASVQVLEFWVARGMLQIFVAVMTKAYFDDSEDKEWLTLLQNIASYMLLGCGVVYIIAVYPR